MDNFKQHGDRILHTLTATKASGDAFVVGTGLLGIALSDGVSGDVIPCAIEGVFEIPKVSGAVIVQGEQVLFDLSALEVDDDAATPATGDFLCGVAMEAGASGDLVIDVRINKTAPSVT